MQNQFIKGVTLSCCLLSSAASYAVDAGFYMGIMGGPATNNGGQQNVQVRPLPTAQNPIANRAIANPQSSQFGTRAYLGYKMNVLAGFELGFIFFSGVNYKLQNANLQPAAGTTFRVRGIDLVGKLDYAFYNTIGLEVKGGVVYVYTTTPGGLNITNYQVITTLNRKANTVSTRTVNMGSNTYASKFAPTFSLGLTYDLNPSWVVDLSWNNYFTGGVVSRMTMYALGISYHFVNRYCGQFLCDD